MYSKLTFFTLTLFFAWSALSAQEACSAFYTFDEGVTFQYSSYNKRGKLQGMTESTISAIEDIENGKKAVLSSTIMDKKGKEQMSGQYEVFCQDNVLKMDVSGILNPGMQEAFAGMEVTIEGTALEVPNQLEVGMELPDANTKISAGTGGLTIVNMTVTIKDRKVEGMEEITTPVGTFNCYKLSQTSDIKMMISREYKSVDYFAEGVGMVRSEMYDKRGNLDSYMELTAYKREPLSD